MLYKNRMSTLVDPRKRIQSLGERGIDVQVVDPESGLKRLIRVNPFDQGAPAFQRDGGGVSEVCNSIKKELNTQNDKATGKSISRPAISTEILPERDKAQSRGDEQRLPSRP